VSTSRGSFRAEEVFVGRGETSHPPNRPRPTSAVVQDALGTNPPGMGIREATVCTMSKAPARSQSRGLRLSAPMAAPLASGLLGWSRKVASGREAPLPDPERMLGEPSIALVPALARMPPVRRNHRPSSRCNLRSLGRAPGHSERSARGAIARVLPLDGDSIWALERGHRHRHAFHSFRAGHGRPTHFGLFRLSCGRESGQTCGSPSRNLGKSSLLETLCGIKFKPLL